VYHYRFAGEGAPLLLLHGFPATSECWTASMTALAARYRVYALDIIGFGGSWPKHHFSLRHAVEHIHLWMKGIGLASADVCGHSMGGQIGLRFAAAYPEHVRKVIAVAPSGLPLEGNVVSLAQRGMVACNYRSVGAALVTLRPALQAGPLVLWGAVREMRRSTIGDVLGAITRPTLIVWGGRDTLLPLHQAAVFHRAIRGSRLAVIPEGGHDVIWARASEFHREVISFLDADAAASASHDGPEVG
jgi:pimeloyl-ACP methyl ester carboxylesterase